MESDQASVEVPLEGRTVEILWIGFAVALIAALLVAWTAHRNNLAYVAGSRWVTHTRAVIESVDQARSEKNAAYDGLRDYSLSGEASQLRTFPAALERLRVGAATLRTQVADHPAQVKRVQSIQDSITRLGRLGAELAGIASGRDRAATLSSTQFDEARRELTSIGNRLTEMDHEEQRILTLRTAHAAAAARRGTMVMTAGGSIVLMWLMFMGGCASFLLSRYRRIAKELEVSRRELQDANAGLEERVRDRSAVLAEQNGLLASILNSMSDAVVMVDTELKPILMNPAAARDLRADVNRPADWLADYDIFAPGSTTPLSSNQPFVARGVAGEIIDGFELRVRSRETGIERWIDTSVRPVRGADGSIRGGLLVIRDVTGRHDARVERALFASVANFVPDAIMSLTLDWIITSWNPGAERMFGYQGEEIIGKSIQTNRRTTFAMMDLIRRTVAEGKSIDNFDTRRVRKWQQHRYSPFRLRHPHLRSSRRLRLTAQDNTEHGVARGDAAGARPASAAQTRAEF